MARKIFKKTVLLCALGTLLSACDRLPDAAGIASRPLEPVQEIPLSGVISSQLAPLMLGGKEYLLLASEVRGLVLIDSNGGEAAALDGGSVERFALQALDDGSWLVAAFDDHSGEIQLRQLALDAGTQRPGLKYLGAQRSSAPQAALCFSRQAGRTHLFAIDETGLGREYVVHPRDGAWLFTEVRPLYFGEQVNSCAVDDGRGLLLVAQPPLGIWSLNADAEKDEERRVFAPAAELGEAFGGFWLGADGNLWLTAGGRALAYNLSTQERTPVFSKLLANIQPVSVAVQGGALLALEEESDILQRYDVELPQPTAEIQALGAPAKMPRVPARAQTEPVASGGDAADDPAIWVNPRDAAASLILGTDKKSGLNIYNLSGKLLQQFPVGRVNNVDLRPVNGGKYAALAAASNRTTPGISLFGITAGGNVDSLGLREMELDDPYGLCLYREGDKVLAWISDKDGDLHLAEILLGENGLDWKLQPRALLKVGSQVEGCVVDDERGTLFFGEEDRGVWRLDIAGFLAGSAEPQLVAAADGKHLVADVEGIGLYRSGDRGYLVVSSQGNNSYALFSRDGSEFIGNFLVDINLDRTLDGSSETDGLEVTGAPLGPDYPAGLLVVQDGRNRMPSASQNFKLVSWGDIAETLELQ
ncbi:phytase [Microbulbifer rhizosphaerae]|uniref:3-phytase n=1 Tax=Microbulbifer rhizosphaerae TaxID=1562603 RepID=A0A7W4WFF6_9GAMM|nr:phytase [Microbulbifer rhizosphaerae]MBB3063244.1 3-phytase [Microbulbifer rhizosphaerae]